ncbi:hypothetical protein [Homoserinimonas hongtaonis]|uniref:hypothetical protein n=1 Tax=Homoserinimonas hongtaonis TaxID=2079791 RepID=UPI00131F0A2A|nr:hypothetical protein [Salinibacterium hongtaonis]
MKKRSKLLVAASIGLLLATGTGITQAQAVTSAVSGAVNCGGLSYPTLYASTRYLTKLGGISITLTNSAGSTYGGNYTNVGLYIPAENSYKPRVNLDVLADPTLPSTGSLLPSGYVVNTAFRMVAAMPASNGTCDNVWGGNLFH